MFCYTCIVIQIEKTSQFFEFYLVFLIFSPIKTDQKFENAPFSLGDEAYGDKTFREGVFENPGSFRDDAYGDIKK
jgi:hypothetical protein